MPLFETLFMASKGQPTEYNGETVFLADTLNAGKQFRLRVRLISTDSEWIQAIQLRVGKGGYLTCEGKSSRIIQLTENTMSSEVELIGTAEDGKVTVNNAWIVKGHAGKETVHSWHNGAAMRKVINDSVVRYYCCDGHPDGSFDNLVFEIEIIE